MTQITVYSKPDCNDCDKTKTMLTSMNIPYNEIDILADSNARNYVKNELKLRQAPAVVTEDGFWGGFNEVKIRDFAATHGYARELVGAGRVAETTDDDWDF